MKYQVTASVTIGGTITIDAASAEDAEKLFIEMVEENTAQFINHKTLEVHHREALIVDVSDKGEDDE